MAVGFPRASPLVLVLGATVASGALGYLVTIVVAVDLGAEAYVGFAVFWSALYLCVGTFSGVQQEVTRASSARLDGTVDNSNSSGARTLAVFTAVLAVAVVLVIAALTTTVGRWVFGDDAAGLAGPLAVGVASFVVVAALSGALYGVRAWTTLAVTIALDGVIRIAAIGLILAADGSLVELGWAVVAPFPLAVMLVLPFVARRLATTLHVDVSYRALSWNVARTVTGAAATALLISGFPLVLQALSADESPAVIGPLILSLTLTRAPIVIPLLALQSYFIVRFGERPSRAGVATSRTVALVLAAAVGLGLLSAVVGPAVLVAVFGAEFMVSGMLLFVLVASSGLVAALCVTGPATLALGHHSAFATGWAAAAATTVLLLSLVPGNIGLRASIALVAGPVAGLIVHAIAISRGARA
jgi:hypothetical protein